MNGCSRHVYNETRSVHMNHLVGDWNRILNESELNTASKSMYVQVLRWKQLCY